MIGTGFMVYLSVVIFLKWIPRDKRLWLYGHELWLELPLGILVYVLHFGTFSGMMAAAVACIFISLHVSVMRKLVGYIKSDGVRVVGWFQSK